MPHHALDEIDRNLVNGGGELPAVAEVGQDIDAVARVELQDTAVMSVEVLSKVPHSGLSHIPLGREHARPDAPEEMTAAPDVASAHHGCRRGFSAGRCLCRLRNWLRGGWNHLRLERLLCGGRGGRCRGRLRLLCCLCGSGCGSSGCYCGCL